jgi:hypothetical protein
MASFVSSYIPTVASQVTRAADNASMIENNFARWYNQTEGTLFAQAALIGSAVNRAFSVGSGLNYMFVVGSQNAVIALGTAQASFNETLLANSTYKTAMAYAADNFASSTNGSAAQVDFSGLTPTGVASAGIGQITSASTFTGSGTIARIAYYNRRLANTELTALTS